MKCFNHTDVEAVATCVDCGKSLCKECASRYEPILCDSCAAARQARHNAGVQEYKSGILGDIIKSVILFAIGFVVNIFVSGFNVGYCIGLGYSFAAFPYGWRALNKITPDIFLFMPLVGWVIYFIIKTVLSLVVGWFAMPIQIIRLIFAYNKN